MKNLRSGGRCRRVLGKLSEVTRILGHQAHGSRPAIISARMERAPIAETVQRNGQWPPAPRRPSLYS
jgi:hypothetical protein